MNALVRVDFIVKPSEFGVRIDEVLVSIQVDFLLFDQAYQSLYIFIILRLPHRCLLTCRRWILGSAHRPPEHIGVPDLSDESVGYFGRSPLSMPTTPALPKVCAPTANSECPG